VADNSGWWLASDGKWYPPELHPSKTSSVPVSAGAPGRAGRTPPPPIAPVGPATRLGPVGSSPGRGGWAGDGYEDLSAARRSGQRSEHALRAPVDARGVFVSLASAVVLVATFLPWYTVTPQHGAAGRVLASLTGQLTILDHGFGGWRFAIPAIALVAVAAGIVDALIRAGQRFALLSFVVVRVLVLAQLGLVIGAMVDRTPKGLDVGSTVRLFVDVRWPVWGALAAAVVALGGSLAASGRP
jgi:hypothetical protein